MELLSPLSLPSIAEAAQAVAAIVVAVCIIVGRIRRAFISFCKRAVKR